MYREGALQGRTESFANVVVIRGSISVMFFTIIMSALLVAALIYGAVTEYGKRHDVRGFLLPETGVVSVSSPAAGTLKLEVEDGEYVEAGTQLGSVVTEQKDVKSNFPHKLLDEYTSERLELLDARRDLIEAEIRLTEKKARLQRTQLTASEAELDSSLNLALKEQESAQRQLERQRALFDKGQLTATALEEAIRFSISSERNFILSQRELSRIRNERDTLEVDIDERLIALEQQLNELSMQEREIRFRLQNANSRAEVGIFAAENGIVSLNDVKNSDFYPAGIPLMRLYPRDADLLAIAIVPPLAISSVTESDTVSLRYTSYPHHEHGAFIGRIQSIGLVPQTQQELNAPFALEEASYRVEIEIAQSPTDKSGAPVRLTPGMTFEVSLVSETMSLLRWLVVKSL